MAFKSLRRAALAATLLLAATCSSSSHSFIVLTLKTSGANQISGVGDVVVKVSKGTTEMKTLTYPASNLTIDAVTATTLSVNFSDDESGNVHFDVEARNNNGCVLGRGQKDKEIIPKGIAEADVTMAPVTDCGADGTDGGTDAPPEGGVFSGCDPVSPTCGPNQTCQVNCVAARNECTPGGSGAPGTVCDSNAQCQPGTQCFNYGTLGCDVKVCLRFCNNTTDCAAFGAGGGGPGSLCEGPVRCSSFDSAYHTCTFNCDPRAAAVATHGGCPTSLDCVALAGMDQVDCACTAGTRTKNIGESCVPSGADCKPGLVCNRMGTTNTCRAICRCDAANDSCTATNDCSGGTTCRPVTNSTLFGVCL